jgi:hypothetical protein
VPYVSDGAVLGWKTGAPERIFGKMKNSVAMAVVAGALIVAATMAAVFRYEVTPVSTTVAHKATVMLGDPNQLAGLVDWLG